MRPSQHPQDVSIETKIKDIINFHDRKYQMSHKIPKVLFLFLRYVFTVIFEARCNYYYCYEFSFLEHFIHELSEGALVQQPLQEILAQNPS